MMIALPLLCVCIQAAAIDAVKADALIAARRRLTGALDDKTVDLHDLNTLLW